MPRGHKSKLRARDKRRQARDEAKGLGDAQATAAEKEDSPSSASPVLGDSSKYMPIAGTGSTPESPERAAGVSGAGSDEDAEGQTQEIESFSLILKSLCEDPLNKNVVLLVYFLMRKYYVKEPITKVHMLKCIIKKYKRRFPEIFKRAALHVELAFGVDLKEVDPIRHCYTFVNKLDLTSDDMFMDAENMPKFGLLMIVLSVIFVRGTCAPEKEVWEVLNGMGIYPGRKHIIYGEPKKVITQEMMQMQYLEYRQVANSDPPHCEFLWGPRAHAEISKMKVLEVVAKFNGTTPSGFPCWYEEALKDEEERARARMEARARRGTKFSACPRANPNRPSCPK